MFVKIKLSTGYVGEDVTDVYEFPDETTTENIEEYGEQLAIDNAEMFGSDEEDASYTYEILNGMTREEIEEEYGTILNS